MSLDVYLHAAGEVVYSANITHNLGRMADEAGIYYALWRPEERGWTRAGEIAPVLYDGLTRLSKEPSHFTTFDSPNGWGRYDHFLPFVARYAEACQRNPDALIEVSR